MQVQVESARPLRFEDGTPLQAASALAPLGDGWLVGQADATHGAWVSGEHVRRLRLLPPVEGLDTFSEAEGTEHLRPDLASACALTLDGGPGVLLLGSGATPLRRRAVLVTEGGDTVEAGDLGPLYEAVARALGLPDRVLDLEGVARNGPVLRWFQRGDAAAGVPNCSVDVALPALLAALDGTLDPADVPLRAVRRYELGQAGGVALAATDAVALPGGRVLLTATATDRGALVLLDGDRAVDAVALPEVPGAVMDVEGLGVREVLPDGVRLVAVVDGDGLRSPAQELALTVRWDDAAPPR